MKKFLAAGVLTILVLAITAGCVTPFSEEVEKDIVAVEEYPGLYLTNDVTALPLATSGYDIYVVGEYHGAREVHDLFIEYLQMLHKTCGLRDVIMEVNRHAEEEANAYALGETDEFNEELWNRPDRIDILERIRALNQELPDRKKIRVHLADLDLAPPQVEAYTYYYIHLTELKEKVGAEHIDIPPAEEFAEWDTDAKLEIVENLTEKTDKEDILNELETVEASIKYEGLMSHLTRNSELYEALEIREKQIAQNIQYILNQLDGAPALALYGGWHTYKIRGKFSDRDPWAHQLVESGVSLYSVFMLGASGTRWIDYNLRNADAEWCWEIVIPLDENTPFKAIFDDWPDYEMAFIDFNANPDLRIPWQFSGECVLSIDTSLSEAMDGMILLKEVTPVRTSLGASWIYGYMIIAGLYALRY
ncbi:MAG: hypothetical protein PVF58_10460 [Candidatus Methanofastidiosia archaeon]|jgi:hypothetical protein